MVPRRYLGLLLVMLSIVLAFSSIISPVRYLKIWENHGSTFQGFNAHQTGEDEQKEVASRLRENEIDMQTEIYDEVFPMPPHHDDQNQSPTQKGPTEAHLKQSRDQYNPARWRGYQDKLQFQLPRVPGQRQPNTADCCTYNGDLEPIPGARGPGLAIIGVQKGGTTYLNSVLTQKCNFYPISCKLPTGQRNKIGANTKEVHFFDILGTNQKHLELYFKGYEAPEGKEDWTGIDATPNTSRMSFAACRMRRVLPNIKAVLLLREPADAMRSSYLMNYGKGNENSKDPPLFSDLMKWNIENLEKSGCLFGMKTWTEAASEAQVETGESSEKGKEVYVVEAENDYEDDDEDDDEHDRDTNTEVRRDLAGRSAQSSDWVGVEAGGNLDEAAWQLEGDILIKGAAGKLWQSGGLFSGEATQKGQVKCTMGGRHHVLGAAGRKLQSKWDVGAGKDTNGVAEAGGLIGGWQYLGGGSRKLQETGDHDERSLRDEGLKTWADCAGCEYSGRPDRGQTGCFPPSTDLTDADVEHGFKYRTQFLPRVMYGPQIAWWLEYFTPDNLLIINSQRLKDHAAQVIREIQTFVGHKANFQSDQLFNPLGQPINFVGRQHQNWREISSQELIKGVEEGYKVAKEAFKPLNQQLYDLLDYYGYQFDKFTDDEGTVV